MASKKTRGGEGDLFARILIQWVLAANDDEEKTGAQRESSGQMGPKVLDTFTYGDPYGINVLAKDNAEVNLSEQGQWLKGEPTPGEPPLFPVASVSVRAKQGKLVEATIRVALFAESPGTVSFVVHGLRFETAEPYSVPDPRTGKERLSPRPFPHVQPLRGWYQRSTCLMHPHLDKESAQACALALGSVDVDHWYRATNEEQPGMPLRNDSVPGLALAFLVSLYGAPRARSIIEKDTLLKQQVISNPDFIRVLGLPTT